MAPHFLLACRRLKAFIKNHFMAHVVRRLYPASRDSNSASWMVQA